MFTSSVRRIALHAQPSPILASVSTSVPRRAASQALSYRSHQRRYSSSKPSNPADGSRGITEGQALPASPTRSRRKTKDVTKAVPRDEALAHLPSVPTTHHVKDKDIAASSFFSLHRPISIHSSFPKIVTDEAFAAIFAPRTRANPKPSDVISTLSTTVNQLEAATEQEQWNAEADELRVAITSETATGSEIKHLDNAPSDTIPFPSHILSKFLPFHPPPPPVPMDTAQSLAAGAEAAAAAQATKHRVYTATITIEESTSADGEITYVAHSSPVVAEDPPTTATPFLRRMNIRQERYNQYRERRYGENDMLAISVKRQRKLKMKKHKYKKLMRRTRNLRRRLDRN